MNPRALLLVGRAMALSCSVDLLANASQRNAQKKEAELCWLGEPEIQNPNASKHRPSRLPPELTNAKVRRSVILLKLCVSETGDVPRVLVLESSGNPDVDKHYMTELSKWTFALAERDKKRVRSVVAVAVTLYIK